MILGKFHFPPIPPWNLGTGAETATADGDTPEVVRGIIGALMIGTDHITFDRLKIYKRRGMGWMK